MTRQETALAKVCLVGAVAALFGWGSLTAQAQELKKYDSNNKNFWANPPDDWFLGDETQAQKGQVPNPGQPNVGDPPGPELAPEPPQPEIQEPPPAPLEVPEPGIRRP